MINRTTLVKEIDTLPVKYLGEVLDFVEHLRQKAENENKNENEEGAYKAMASDIEREQEAGEWCNAYFGPVCS